jgi:ABC-2 type transport system permease protein
MDKIWIIARKDTREALRSRSTYIYIFVMFILTFTYYTSYSAQINSLVRQNAGQQQILEDSRLILNSLAYILPMMYSIFICSIFANYSVVVDKAKRNIESLMATPISLNQIWMGKALAVTIPSAVIGIGMAIISYVVINVVATVQHPVSFVIPDIFAILTALIVVPSLLFAIVAVVIYVQLVISNPRIASLVFTGIFLILFFGANVISGLGLSLNVGIIFIGMAVLCGGIAYLLSRSLTKEKVVLSSKG